MNCLIFNWLLWKKKQLGFISRSWGLMGSLWAVWHTVHTVCAINRKVTSGLDRWWNWLRIDVRILGPTVPFMLCFSSTGRTMTSGWPPFWCLEFWSGPALFLSHTPTLLPRKAFLDIFILYGQRSKSNNFCKFILFAYFVRSSKAVLGKVSLDAQRDLWEL